MSENQKGLQESLDHIIKHMVTRDDVRDIVREEVRDIVHDELTTAIEEMKIATKDDIKGIVSSAHNRIDQEGISRKELEVRVTHLERRVGV